MNLDMTFCGGLRCGKEKQCERWIENLRKEAEEIGRDLTNRPISLGQFADHDGKCTMFVKLERP